MSIVLVLNQTTQSCHLKPLTRDGYIQLSSDQKDQRIKKRRLTRKGEKLYLKALSLWEDAQRELIDNMDKENADQSLSQSFMAALT